MSDFTKMSVNALSEGLRNKSFSSLEITKAFIDASKKDEGSVDAYLTLTPDEAIAAAKAADKKLAEGEKLPPLAGIPAAIKDNICTKGIKTTCASKLLRDFVPCYDATVIEKLKANGYVLLGKLNMDEFAMGSSNENSAFKPVKNPRDLTRVPGGSSGGAAAAVAANEAAYSLGSDTGGSIRQPAAFCGVVGMKPTYGRVSRFGLIAFASSLDQIGPFTNNVADNARVLSAVSGKDRRDATSADTEVPDFTAELNKGVKGLKIGLPKEFFAEGIAEDVKASVLAAAKTYEKLGAEVFEISMPALNDALPAYYVISSAEASSNLARFDGVRYGYRSDDFDSIEELYKNTRNEGFGTEVKRRIMLGTFALSSGYYDAYYKKALQVRSLIAKQYSAVFEKCDVLLSPVAPTVAYKLGEKTANPLEMYMGDMYTVPINIAGVPALALPCGKNAEGLPVGMQLIGKHFSESLLYRTANAFETEGGAF